MYSYSRINAHEVRNLPSLTAKKQYLDNFLSKSPRYSDYRDVLEHILKQEDQLHQHSLMLHYLEQIANNNPGDLRSCLGQFDYSLDYCKTFATFLLVIKYMINYDAQVSTSALENSFNGLARRFKFYENEVMGLEGKNLNLAPHAQLVDAIKMGMDVLPKLYLKLNRTIDFSYLSILIEWAIFCPATSVEECVVISKYSRFLAEQCMNSSATALDAFGCVETKRLLKYVIEKSVLEHKGAENLCFMIETLNDMVISSAISSGLEEFTSYPVDTYLKCFDVLTRGSLGPRTCRFFICLSNALKEQYHFHVLQRIYEEFIIDKLPKYYKFTTQAQTELQDLMSMYIYGFIEKFTLDPEKIKNFLTDYRLLTKKQMSFWLEMAVTIAYKQPSVLRALMPLINQITPLGSVEDIVSDVVYETQKKHSWRFLEKDLKNKKRYQLTPCKKSGIVNENINCYIITVMQAFFMSKTLPKIIASYSNQYSTRSYGRDEVRLPLLYQLNRLFENLKWQTKAEYIDDVKKVGPEDFRNDHSQQDSQHYFNDLFESINKEINNLPDERARQEFQERFKDTFELIIRNERVCERCHNKSENTMECYIHSIDYKETLCEEWESILEDYTCDKCKHKGNQKEKSTIIKFPEIIIVHIKRFHFDRDLGEVKKLEEADIVRRFQDYELQGFISHIGNQVRCGHYILYYKSPDHPLTWLLFNDVKVDEFKIDTEDERFEENFKSENTPYIVIYKRVEEKK